MGLLIGGGVLGCLAGGFALTADAPSQPKLAPALSASVPRLPALRVVSAPDRAHLDAAKAARPRGAQAEALRRHQAQVAAVHVGVPRGREGRGGVPLAVHSHRFDPAQSSLWATFVPVASPKSVVVAEVKPAPAGHFAPAVSKPAAGPAPVQLASLEPAHVEVALPDLPVERIDPPRSAEAALEQALAVPMPTARPFRRAVAAQPDQRHRARTPSTLLAYARPDAGALSDDGPAMAPERPAPTSPALKAGTAIYDISASIVYLPNGERLEAHSGLGSLRDDVRYVHVKNRGPTPPHTYNLTMRESLFHGVAAIRLTPIGGEGRIHNRNGLLAHTYMLGPRGDSNGCVSFKDYKRFLAAFKRGEIRRLVVVPSYRTSTSRIASLLGIGKR